MTSLLGAPHGRKPDESFGDAVARLGADVFKRELYAAA